MMFIETNILRVVAVAVGEVCEMFIKMNYWLSRPTWIAGVADVSRAAESG